MKFFLYDGDGSDLPRDVNWMNVALNASAAVDTLAHFHACQMCGCEDIGRRAEQQADADPLGTAVASLMLFRALFERMTREDLAAIHPDGEALLDAGREGEKELLHYFFEDLSTSATALIQEDVTDAMKLMGGYDDSAGAE